MAYKHKYLIIRENPYNQGETVAQINLTGLNKKESNKIWDNMDTVFEKDRFTSCLTECNNEMAEYIKYEKIKS